MIQNSRLALLPTKTTESTKKKGRGTAPAQKGLKRKSALTERAHDNAADLSDTPPHEHQRHGNSRSIRQHFHNRRYGNLSLDGINDRTKVRAGDRSTRCALQNPSFLQKIMVAGDRFELSFHDAKSSVLPLHYPAIFSPEGERKKGMYQTGRTSTTLPNLL